MDMIYLVVCMLIWSIVHVKVMYILKDMSEKVDVEFNQEINFTLMKFINKFNFKKSEK